MHIFRFCLILKCLNVACTVVPTLVDCNLPELTIQFEQACIARIESLQSEDFVIDLAIANAAVGLVECSHKTKMILASYTFDSTLSFQQIMRTMLEQQTSRPTTTGIWLNYESKLVNLMKKTMKHASYEIDTAAVLGGNGTIEMATSAFLTLQKHGLGIVVKHRNEENNKMVTFFRRLSYGELSTSASLGRLITDLGINLPQLLESYLFAEADDSEKANEERRKNNKRKSPIIEPATSNANKASTPLNKQPRIANHVTTSPKQLQINARNGAPYFLSCNIIANNGFNSGKPSLPNRPQIISVPNGTYSSSINYSPLESQKSTQRHNESLNFVKQEPIEHMHNDTILLSDDSDILDDELSKIIPFNKFL
jgi:hypothetical protein